MKASRACRCAFQVADAKTVVASLWSVNDEETRIVMTEFYRNLWRENFRKEKHSGNTQLKMLRGELLPGEARPW